MNGIVDKIFVISTTNSTRCDKISDELKKFTDNFEIIQYTPAKSTTNNGGKKDISFIDLCKLNLPTNDTSENIAINHIKTIKRGYELGYNRIMILEDDIEILSKDLIGDMIIYTEWLNSHHNTYDIFYLGYFTWPIGILRISYKIGKLFNNVTLSFKRELYG